MEAIVLVPVVVSVVVRIARLSLSLSSWVSKAEEERKRIIIIIIIGRRDGHFLVSVKSGLCV